MVRTHPIRGDVAPEVASPATCALMHLGTLALALLGACASAVQLPREVEIAPRDLVTVTLHQNSRVKLTLRTPGGNNREEIYSDLKADPQTKVCAVAQLQPLLDLFANHGFFRRAARVDPDPTRTALSVTINGQSRTWVRPRLAATDAGVSDAALAEITEFRQCMAYFTGLYNGVEGFASMPLTADELKRRNREALEAIRRKHEIDSKNEPQDRDGGR